MQQTVISVPVQECQPCLRCHTCDHLAPLSCAMVLAILVVVQYWTFHVMSTLCFCASLLSGINPEQRIFVPTMAIEDSLASLHPTLSPREVHEQGVGSLQTTSHVHAVIIMPVELLAWLIPAYAKCPYWPCSQYLLLPKETFHSDVSAWDPNSSLLGRLCI